MSAGPNIANALRGESGRCGGDWPFAGYSASGDRLRDALAPLFEADGVRLASGPGGWRLAPVALAGEPLALAGFREARRIDALADRAEHRRAPLSSLPGTIRLRHYEPERDYQLGQQTGQVAGGGAGEERIDLPAVLPATSARGLAQRLAAAAADGRETLIWQGDLAALALTVGHVVILADGSAWRLAARTVRWSDITLELKRHQPLPITDMPAEPGVPVSAPDWPDAVGAGPTAGSFPWPVPSRFRPARCVPRRRWVRSPSRWPRGAIACSIFRAPSSSNWSIRR